MNHLSFEQISELAESRLPDAESRDHLASCGECRATLERVQRLLESTQGLPRDIAPPPEVWSSLRARVSSAPRRARRWSSGWLALAATIVFVAGAALLLPPSVGKGKGKGASSRPDAAAHAPAVLAVERNYSATLDDLRRTLEQQRGALSPATLRVVERSLAIIDSAIVEARAALSSDPSNQELVQILSAQLEHKVDLLQRATQLPSS